jgi:DNA-binding SARP family transcriptional activator
LKPRTLLALLLTDANRVVSTARIIEALWGDDANERSPSTLQVHVSNLRRALAPAATALGVDEIVRTQRPGYLVSVDATTVDLAKFRELVASGQQQAGHGDTRGASQTFAAALALVRGDPLADLSDEPFAAPVSAYLRQLVAHARAARFETELAIGHHREVVGEIDAAVVAEPLDEHLRALQMLALYRCGRQADALAAYQAARRVLVDELGVDPSAELRELESQILAQDAALTAPVPMQRDGELRTVLRSSVLVPSAVLVIQSAEPQTVFLTRPVTTIGRRDQCDIVLDDPQASRLHAEIRVDAGRFFVIDRQSTNGTRVNGSMIEEHELQPGDEIAIGGQRLQFDLVAR